MEEAALNMMHVHEQGRLKAILARLFSLGMGGGRKERECRPAVAGNEVIFTEGRSGDDKEDQTDQRHRKQRV